MDVLKFARMNMQIQQQQQQQQQHNNVYNPLCFPDTYFFREARGMMNSSAELMSFIKAN